jgi:hypothetical protein
LAAAEDVQDQDGQRGEHDRGDDGRDVDVVLTLETPQREWQDPLVWALGEDQR